jgi:hypothetical protein
MSCEAGLKVELLSGPLALLAAKTITGIVRRVLAATAAGHLTCNLEQDLAETLVVMLALMNGLLLRCCHHVKAGL